MENQTIEDITKNSKATLINNGLADMINSLIKSEFDAITDYNNAISTLLNESKDEDLIAIFHDILEEENIHVGQLQKALQKVSPSAENIDKGVTEAEGQLGEDMVIKKDNKLFEEINNVGEFEDKIHPEVPASFSAAVEDSRELEDKAKKVFKDKEKELKDLHNEENDRINGLKIKYPNGSKKLHLEESLFEEAISKITPETTLRKAVEIITPDEFQLEKIRDDISLKDIWEKIKEGKDFYAEASVDGEGFDSAVREKIFMAIEEALNIDYDTIFNMWLMELKRPSTKNDRLKEKWHRPPTTDLDIYLVPKKRKPLADLLQKYLTSGEFEWGYVKHPDGTVNPTPLKGAEYPPRKVGVYYDELDNSYIKVSASSEEELKDAKEIADKFGKEYKIIDNSKKSTIKPGFEFQLLIKVEDEDWDKPYFNPDDEVYDGANK